MAQRGIRVEGAREIRRQLRNLRDDVGTQMLRDAHRKLADRVARAALPRVPVRTGALAGSVRGLGSVTAATGKAGGARVPYAAAIHFGVGPRPGEPGPHNIKARPFLFEALDRTGPNAADEYAEQMRRLLSRLGGLNNAR